MIDTKESALKVGETRFHYGKHRREINISTDMFNLNEDWVAYDSDDGKLFHSHRIESILQEKYKLSENQLIEMLKIHYPEKLI